MKTQDDSPLAESLRDELVLNKIYLIRCVSLWQILLS